MEQKSSGFYMCVNHRDSINSSLSGTVTVNKTNIGSNLRSAQVKASLREKFSLNMMLLFMRRRSTNASSVLTCQTGLPVLNTPQVTEASASFPKDTVTCHCASYHPAIPLKNL